MQNYNFTCGPVWERNLVSDIKGGTRLRAFENRVLRETFGPKRDEMTGVWRKLHNEEFRNLYSSPSIIRMIKSRRIRWVQHVAQMGDMKNAYRILVRKPKEGDHWKDQDVFEWILLQWILERQDGVV
jgi:hypothetical protein